MEEIFSKKKDIEAKLERDRQNLAAVKDSMAKSNQLCQNMAAALVSFETRLRRLEDAILPVHRQTLSLTRLQENVEKTLSALHHVISYHHVADEVEQAVRDGPAHVDIEVYLKHMDRVVSARDFFARNNEGSMELATIAELYGVGLDHLCREFRSQLKRNSRPVPVAFMMDLASAGADDELRLELLPERVLEILSVISQWLSGTGNYHDFLSIYYQIRSSQLDTSMRDLRDAARRSGSSVNAVPIGAMKKMSSLKDTPNRRPIFRHQHQQSQRNRRMSVQLHHDKIHSSGGLGRDLSRGSAVAVPVEESLEGTHAFISCSTVFLRLMQSERNLMQSIIPSHQHRHTFENLIKPPMDFFILEGEALVSAMKRAVAKNDFQSVLAALRILQHLQALMSQYQDLLKGLKGDPAGRVLTLMTLFEATCLKALDDFIEYVKNDPDKISNMPKDGTVHELTSSTILFLQQCLEFADLLGRLLLPHDPVAQGVVNPRKRALGSYFHRVLSVLRLNMEMKAKCYEADSLQVIFRLNNYHFVHKSLVRSNEMLSVVEEASPDVEDNYMDLIGKQRKQYQKVWTKLLNHILEQGKPHRESLSKSDRQDIKEKFKGFNTELDEIYRIQRAYAIPDERLRQSVRQDNIELIVQFYRTFLDKYSSIPFTKNPEKYIRYKVADVERKLNSFFDVSA